jgi:hypothetical protein
VISIARLFRRHMTQEGSLTRSRTPSYGPTEREGALERGADEDENENEGAAGEVWDVGAE